MMFTRLPNILLTGLLVSEVSGSLILKSRDFLSHLTARQINGVANAPPQCQSVCEPAGTAFGMCNTPDCTCTASNAQLLASCINCDVSVDPSQRMALQMLLDVLIGACDGFSIGSPTITVISPSSTGSSSTPAAVPASSSVTTSSFGVDTSSFGVDTSSSGVGTSSFGVGTSSSGVGTSSSGVVISSSSNPTTLTLVPLSTPTTPATPSPPVSQSAATSTSASSTTNVTSASDSSSSTTSASPSATSSGASHLVVFNKIIGAGAGVVAGLAMALV